VRCVRVTLFAVQEQYYIFRVFVFIAFVIRHVKCVRHVILSSVACLAVLCLSTLSLINGTTSRKKIIERKLDVVIIYIAFIWNVSHPKMNRVR
jgi:hypothetical protein